jgi:hypothetical protein
LQQRKLVQRDWREESVIKMEIIDLRKEKQILTKKLIIPANI